MTEEVHFGDLDEAMAALKRDLLSEDGPRISTMRNYRFAILPYLPSEEFKLRHHMLRLTEELRAEGWAVLPISLQKLLIERSRPRPCRCQRHHCPPRGGARRHRRRRGQADR